MKTTIVKGQIKTLGPSIILADGGKVYDYILVEDEKGEEIYIRKVSTSPNVDGNLSAGFSGTLVVLRQPILVALTTSKSSAGPIVNELAGIKNESFESVSGTLTNPGASGLLIWILMIILGLVLSIFLIGIPIVIYSIIQIILIPKSKKDLTDLVTSAGFKLTKPKVL